MGDFSAGFSVMTTLLAHFVDEEIGLKITSTLWSWGSSLELSDFISVFISLHLSETHLTSRSEIFGNAQHFGRNNAA